MNCKRLLAYVTGSVDEELLARNEYLVTENRILRGQIKGRIRLTDPETYQLGVGGQTTGPQSAGRGGQIVRPETILRWHRRLIAKKFDGSIQRIGHPVNVTRRAIRSKNWCCRRRRRIARGDIGGLRAR